MKSVLFFFFVFCILQYTYGQVVITVDDEFVVTRTKTRFVEQALHHEAALPAPATQMPLSFCAAVPLTTTFEVLLGLSILLLLCFPPKRSHDLLLETDILHNLEIFSPVNFYKRE